MKNSLARIKVIIASAIFIIAVLLAVCICELISIHAMQKKVSEQNSKIDELNKQVDYYNNLENDDNEFDYLIN